MTFSVSKFISRVAIVALLSSAAAAFGPSGPAEAGSCGGKGQKACPWHKKGPECNAWLREIGGICKPCGSKNQRACKVVSKGPACKSGLLIKGKTCVPANQTIIGKVGGEIEQVSKKVAEGVDGALRSDTTRKVKQAAAKHVGEVAGIAKKLRAALPSGRDAKALADAIRNKDTRKIDRLIRANPALTQLFDDLRAMHFNTMTIGIESSGSFALGAGHETGAALDLSQHRSARLYTTTSLSGGYHFGGGNDLVFSFFRKSNGSIDGHAFGTIAEFDAGSGAGINMWFSAKPFDFEGFSIGVGIGSVGGGGAVTYGVTKLWN